MSGARERMAAFIAAQREAYLVTLRERVAAIESLWAEALRGAAMDELRRLAHTVHGTAGTYGFAQASQAAAELEAALAALGDSRPPDGHERDRVARAIAALRQSLPE